MLGEFERGEDVLFRVEKWRKLYSREREGG